MSYSWLLQIHWSNFKKKKFQAAVQFQEKNFFSTDKKPVSEPELKKSSDKITGDKGNRYHSDKLDKSKGKIGGGQVCRSPWYVRASKYDDLFKFSADIFDTFIIPMKTFVLHDTLAKFP